MWYRFISYIRFLFTSKNQHGVHSPFIYNYITQCLYRRSPINLHKVRSLSVLFRNVAYFNAKNLWVVPQSQEIQRLLQDRFPETRFNALPADLIYVHQLKDMPPFANFMASGQVHNDTVLLINDIHKDREHLRKWQALINSEQIRVSVDMFYCGALFLRKEQAKQHFKIRI